MGERCSPEFESEEVFWSWLKAVARSAARDTNRKQRRYAALLERFSLANPVTSNSFFLINLLQPGNQ